MYHIQNVYVIKNKQKKRATYSKYDNNNNNKYSTIIITAHKKQKKKKPTQYTNTDTRSTPNNIVNIITIIFTFNHLL